MQWKTVKNLTKGKINSIHCQLCHCRTPWGWSGRIYLSLIRADYSQSPDCPLYSVEMVCSIICFTFSGIKVKLTGQYFPRSCFPSYLETGVALSQSSGASPSCHDFSEITKSGLAMTFASALSTCRYTPLSPKGLFTSSLFKFPQVDPSLLRISPHDPHWKSPLKSKQLKKKNWSLFKDTAWPPFV